MKKIITFIVTVLLSLCTFAQSYDIKIYLCKSGESDFLKALKAPSKGIADTDFLKALKAPSKDIADKFGKLVCSFKISGNQDVSINKIHKFEKSKNANDRLAANEVENIFKNKFQDGLKLSAYCREIEKGSKIALMLDLYYGALEGLIELDSKKIYPMTIISRHYGMTFLNMDTPIALNSYFSSSENGELLFNYFLVLASKASE